MSYVPHIIINGVRLSRAQAVTVQVAVTDLQMSDPSVAGGGAIDQAIAASYRANASSVLKIMRDGHDPAAGPEMSDAVAAQPARPMSRAEEHILTLASRSNGYAPARDAPWWAAIAPWHARRLLSRLEADGLIVRAERPDGQAVFYRVAT